MKKTAEDKQSHFDAELVATEYANQYPDRNYHDLQHAVIYGIMAYSKFIQNQFHPTPTEAEINEAAEKEFPCLTGNFNHDDYIVNTRRRAFVRGIQWIQNYQTSARRATGTSNQKYRVGRKSGTVILTHDGTREIGRIHDADLAAKVCEFLNCQTEGMEKPVYEYPHITKLIEQGKQDSLLNKEVDLFLSINDGGYDTVQQAFKSGAHFGKQWQASQPNPAIDVIEDEINNIIQSQQKQIDNCKDETCQKCETCQCIIIELIGLKQTILKQIKA